MDKRKVITAYRRGFITMHECAQILGVDSLQIMGYVNEPELRTADLRVKKESISN